MSLTLGISGQNKDPRRKRTGYFGFETLLKKLGKTSAYAAEMHPKGLGYQTRATQ